MKTQRIVTLREVIMANDKDLFVNIVSQHAGRKERANRMLYQHKTKRPLFKTYTDLGGSLC